MRMKIEMNMNMNKNKNKGENENENVFRTTDPAACATGTRTEQRSLLQWLEVGASVIRQTCCSRDVDARRARGLHREDRVRLT